MEKNEKVVFTNPKDKKRKHKAQFQQGDLFRIADIRKSFSKRDSTLWSFKSNTTTKIIHDTIPL